MKPTVNKPSPAPKSAPPAAILGVERDDLGNCLHTALRKFCASNASSLVWNLVYLTDEGWNSYLDLAWAELERTRPKTSEKVAGCLAAAAGKINYGTHERTALRLALDYLSTNDWNGMAGYFECP